MAEFCFECFNRLKLGDKTYKEEELIISDEEDFCEGCAEWHPVVISIK